MKPLAITITLASALTVFAAMPSAVAAEDPSLQRLALCQDSWFDFKDDDARMTRFAGYFEGRFDRDAQGAGFSPKQRVQALGYNVTQVYPQSVGMGVGFSLVINADFAQARAAVEKQLGKPMSCTTSDGMRACEAPIGEKKTAMLITGQNGAGKTSLVGCYYFYQQ